MTPIADDYANIRSRLAEIEAGQREKDTVCLLCEGGGWTAYGLGHGDPHFRVCEACGNPEGVPCP